jgi:hypothetical protein
MPSACTVNPDHAFAKAVPGVEKETGHRNRPRIDLKGSGDTSPKPSRNRPRIDLKGSGDTSPKPSSSENFDYG